MTAKYIYDGEILHEESVLILEGDKVKEIKKISEIEEGVNTAPLGEKSALEDWGSTLEEESVLTSGLIDLQMNGGGGA